MVVVSTAFFCSSSFLQKYLVGFFRLLFTAQLAQHSWHSTIGTAQLAQHSWHSTVGTAQLAQYCSITGARLERSDGEPLQQLAPENHVRSKYHPSRTAATLKLDAPQAHSSLLTNSTQCGGGSRHTGLEATMIPELSTPALSNKCPRTKMITHGGTQRKSLNNCREPLACIAQNAQLQGQAGADRPITRDAGAERPK